MLIIKAKSIISKEKMKNIYETFFKQMQDGLVLVDDRYEISIVEPSMEWIPVSERLPEKSDVYIVTVKLHPESKPYTDSAFYSTDNKQWEDGPCNEYDMVTDITNEVIAWMPLPEPYKVESEEIHCDCTDEEIAKSFIEDVEAVKDLLPSVESEEI